MDCCQRWQDFLLLGGIVWLFGYEVVIWAAFLVYLFAPCSPALAFCGARMMLLDSGRGSQLVRCVGFSIMDRGMGRSRQSVMGKVSIQLAMGTALFGRSSQK